MKVRITLSTGNFFCSLDVKEIEYCPTSNSLTLVYKNGCYDTFKLDEVSYFCVWGGNNG